MPMNRIALTVQLTSDLRQRREAQGLSQSELAVRLGWTRSKVKRLESFESRTVTQEDLEHLTRVLGEPQSETAHRQVGPPVMVNGYRVRVLDDPEHASYLAKATHESHRDAHYGTPRIDTIIVTGNGVLLEGEGMTRRFVPADALAAVLKVGGWKVSTS